MICLVVGSSLGAEHTSDGVYSGKRVLTKGTASPMCPSAEDVSVTIHGVTLTFANRKLKKFAISFYPSQMDHSAKLIREVIL
jgi:hypothetical protein